MYGKTKGGGVWKEMAVASLEANMETLEATAAVGFEREVQFLLQSLSEKGKKKADIKQLQRL